jgi:hypothetical protein
MIINSILLYAEVLADSKRAGVQHVIPRIADMGPAGTERDCRHEWDAGEARFLDKLGMRGFSGKCFASFR